MIYSFLTLYLSLNARDLRKFTVKDISGTSINKENRQVVASSDTRLFDWSCIKPGVNGYSTQVKAMDIIEISKTAVYQDHQETQIKNLDIRKNDKPKDLNSIWLKCTLPKNKKRIDFLETHLRLIDSLISIAFFFPINIYCLLHCLQYITSYRQI